MMVSTSTDSTETALSSPTVVVEPVSVQKRQETFLLEAEASSIEDICDNGGKGPADRMAATIKGHITRFINEGNNVTNAKEMENAILSHGGLPGIRVVMLDSLGEPETVPATQQKITGISKLNNFRFYPDGMRVWQAFDIGPGKCISLEGTNDMLLFSTERHYQNISVTFSLGEFKEIAPRRKLKEPTKTSTADPAEEEDYGQGCTRSFQRHCSLEKHLAFGKCTKTVERETLLDKAKVKYAARLEEGSSSVPTIPLPPETCPRNTGYVTPLEGFALKQVKKAYRFNEKQREYLTARFTIGQESGKKVDAGIVATEMRRAKGLNGERLFSVSEFLTTQQVASFFSRMAAKVKQQTAPCAQAVTEQDLLAMEEEFNLSNAKESVFEQLNVTHPIHY
ncbi:unnamed protein product [Porites lobata]|uniref:Uncharacterized protein n=1 Tax=Porites lobata TaxID=104759 RepID=A0ABN8NPT9_9CNID|nr:unnamed protein product [Porites lobata]